MEDWIEALSLILKIFTAYTAVISIFFLLPRAENTEGGGPDPVCGPIGGPE